MADEWESWSWKKRTHGSVLQPASFQRRYVRIEKSVLSYYKRPSDVEPRGSIKLDSLIRIFPSDSSDVGKSKPAKDFGSYALSCSTTSRTYHFLFETPSDFDSAIISIWGNVQQNQFTLHAKLRTKLNVSVASLKELKNQQTQNIVGSALNNPPMNVQLTHDGDVRQSQPSIKSATINSAPDRDDIVQSEENVEDESRDFDEAGTSEASTAPSKTRWLRSMFVKKKGLDEVGPQEVELQTRSPSEPPQGPSPSPVPSLPSQNSKSRKDIQKPPKSFKADTTTINIQPSPKSGKQIVPKPPQRSHQMKAPSRLPARGAISSSRGPLTENLLDDEDEDDDNDDYDDDSDDDDSDDESDEEHEKTSCCEII